MAVYHMFSTVTPLLGVSPPAEMVAGYTKLWDDSGYDMLWPYTWMIMDNYAV